MRPGRLVQVVLAAVAAVAASGCVDIVPNLGSRDVPADAPAIGGRGSTEWRIEVHDPWGAPLVGAAVVAYWPVDPRPCEGNRNATCIDLEYVQLRTDSEGAVRVLSANEDLTVVASASGYSEEWRLATPPTGDRRIVLNLFPPAATHRIEGVWSSLDLFSTRYGACQMHVYTLGGDVEPELWLQRTNRVNATLRWTNSVGAAADFDLAYHVYLAASDEPFQLEDGCPDRHNPRPDQLESGAREVNLTVYRGMVENQMDEHSGPVLFGPVARGAVVGIELEYNLTLEAELVWRDTAGYVGMFGAESFEYDALSARDVTHSSDVPRSRDGTPSRDGTLSRDGTHPAGRTHPPSSDAPPGGKQAPTLAPLLVAVAALGAAAGLRRTRG